MQGNTKQGAEPAKRVSPGLLRVTERAIKDPHARFTSLAHHLNEDALMRAYGRLRKNAAVGVDGVTAEEYGENLAGNIADLHKRLKAMQYRHQPILRVNIPKEDGRTRPIGVSTTEDKIVQGALQELLGAIYEADFKSCSYGFRPGIGAHDALRSLDNMVFREKTAWILEADIRAFFDSVDRRKLREVLQLRIADENVMRLIGKCLHVGVLDGEQFLNPEEGVVQGSSLSPILGNIYLHYVLDAWFEQIVKPGLVGSARLIRYADDFVIGFECQEDAERVMQLLEARMAVFGLELHPDKTRLLPFHKPPATQVRGKGPGTFDFLGFTMYWQRTRRGGWRLGMRTRRGRFSKSLAAIREWCRHNMHRSLEEQHTALRRRLEGTYNYFGVNGNVPMLKLLLHHVERIWLSSLRRRSQRGRSLTWNRFQEYLETFPLPKPRIYDQIWGKPPRRGPVAKLRETLLAEEPYGGNLLVRI